MTKYRLLREAAETQLPGVRVTEAPAATDGELALAHEPAWIAAVAHRLHRRGLQVIVIDLDVHQGNGTASIFRDDPTVFTLSLHGARNFPFRKEASDLDVELPDGCTDGPYLDAGLAGSELMHRRAHS